jgi:hypothetical protein
MDLFNVCLRLISAGGGMALACAKSNAQYTVWQVSPNERDCMMNRQTACAWPAAVVAAISMLKGTHESGFNAQNSQVFRLSSRESGCPAFQRGRGTPGGVLHRTVSALTPEVETGCFVSVFFLY